MLRAALHRLFAALALALALVSPVAAQPAASERGVPAHPATHLIEGVWRE
jgi:hypothetical protein